MVKWTSQLFDGSLYIVLLIVVTVRANIYFDEFKHECIRTCMSNDAKLCKYEFHLEWYAILSQACFDCPRNKTDCDRPHCITADGVRRAIMSVNRQVPGPSVQVCEGDTISVTVHNTLQDFEGVSIHWHGIHQRKTPWMDGVAKLTQCPISTMSTFEYRFEALPAGTHFWHAHAGLQRADGIFGNFVVRKSNDHHSQLYDKDLPEHVIMVYDWSHVVATSKYAEHFHAKGDNKPENIIVNGKGVYNKMPFRSQITNQTTYTPRALFRVSNGTRYRFRISSNAILYCPMVVSIDSHTLTMITSDGMPFQPITVDSFIIYAGETFDFVVNANQEVANYLMRFQGVGDCGVNHTKALQSAILHYEGANAMEFDDLPNPDFEKMGPQASNPVQLNPHNEHEDKWHIGISSLNATGEALINEEDVQGTPDHVFILAFDFEKINNSHWYVPQYYPLPTIQKAYQVYTPQINYISMKLPPSPLLYQYDSLKDTLFCNNTEFSKNCAPESNNFCSCVHTLKVNLGDLVEIVLIDKGFTFDASHPFHMHGDYFRVLAVEKVGKSLSPDEFKQMESNGTVKRRYGGVLKDTVVVPDGGYSIVRFKATNPGPWLFHCHLELHVETGMGLILQIGAPQSWPKVPDGFERCGSWNPIYPNFLSVIPIHDKVVENSLDNTFYSIGFYVLLGICLGLVAVSLILVIFIVHLRYKIQDTSYNLSS